MRANEQETTLVVRDCSPFPPLTRDQDEWLRRLVAETSANSVLLRLQRQPANPGADEEPVATLDAASGKWWAGRYVGEVIFEGQALRIEPRFGMPALVRWLATIWGVRFFETRGAAQEQRIWLWAVVAHLWAARLIAAAKHGLPSRRIYVKHRGHALRGRLLTRETVLARIADETSLVSESRIKMTDGLIGGIVLAACDRLGEALALFGARWLPDRALELVRELEAALGRRLGVSIPSRHATVRYTPITEGYRPVVELSLSILAHRPIGSSQTGDRKAFGILLDMAEIWELYLAKVLHTGLADYRVVHTGRSTEHIHWLLRSSSGDDHVGSLRPDILVFDHDDRCVGIVDAKYKSTRLNANNRTGVLAEDLYQLAAYLSAFGHPQGELSGLLIYPADDLAQVSKRLAPKNPWSFSAAPDRHLWFVSAELQAPTHGDSLSDAEDLVAATVRAAIERAVIKRP